MVSPLYPPPLKFGDTIAIIAPAGQLPDKNIFMNGVKILNKMGFKVSYPENLWPGSGAFSDNDIKRGHEFNSSWQDPETKALVALRGGYGCVRIIDKINLNQVIENPKLLFGFSDITILQNYLFNRVGLISMHGPVLTTLGDATIPAQKRYQQCLTGQWTSPLEFFQFEILKGSRTTSAPLIGGNLSSLVSLLGTRYDFNWSGSIVFLEDTNEPFYRIDRMLTQLSFAGKFNDIKGLLLGDFSFSISAKCSEKLNYLQLIWDRVLEICGGWKFPVWGNIPCGHCPQNLTLPLGAKTIMDMEKKCLHFHE